MSRKGIFLVIFLNFIFLSFSQEKERKPNFKRIRKEIKKKHSDFYYPKLVKKFTNGVSMSLKEKRHLYYGFAFFASYDPYKITKYYSKINQIISAKKFSEENLNKLLNYINLELANKPFDIKLLKLKMFVYKRLHNKAALNIIKNQIQVIKDAILSSGNGRSTKTAFAVVLVSNEYDVLHFIGLKEAKNSYFNKKLEYIKVQPNKNDIKGIYFDVSLIMRRINAKVKK